MEKRYWVTTRPQSEVRRVFPTPSGPRKQILNACFSHIILGSWSICSLKTLRRKPKPKKSSVFSAGRLACFLRRRFCLRTWSRYCSVKKNATDFSGVRHLFRKKGNQNPLWHNTDQPAGYLPVSKTSKLGEELILLPTLTNGFRVKARISAAISFASLWMLLLPLVNLFLCCPTTFWSPISIPSIFLPLLLYL